MAKTITPNQIKQNNRNLIFQYIYKSREQAVSQQDISYALRLSRPTVTANLNSLEQAGLIRRDGVMDSEFVGRKATGYRVVPNFRVGIGVEILRRDVKIVAVDLYGELISRHVIPLPYENQEEYFASVCHLILAFLAENEIRDEQVLGVGFAMQGLVSADKQTVIYGKILSCTGLTAERFARYLPYPCVLAHDADSAAISELWVSPELQDGLYLSLSRHLGAAIISDGKIKTGKHGHSATIEHIQIEPNGKACYCGKQGCIETLCSMDALLDGAPLEAAEAFFQRLRAGEERETLRWHRYLDDLARSINLIHLVQDTDFILGGYLARYLRDADLQYLYARIRELAPFEEASDFLRISKMPKHNISIGTALPFIQDFLADGLPSVQADTEAVQ